MTESTRPCCSPYCECPEGQCSHPGCYDARGQANQLMVDAVTMGTGWSKNGVRIDPKDVFLDPPPPVDHKALLIKYMQYLTRTQGTTYLFNAAKASFTESEFAELRRLLWEET